MALFDWLRKKQSAPAALGPELEDLRKRAIQTTIIEKRDFALDLLGEWEEHPLEDGHQFFNQLWRLELNVTILRAKTPLTPGQIKSSVEHLAELRRNSMREVDKLGSIGEIWLHDERTTIEARFPSESQKYNVRSATLIRGCPTKIVSAHLIQHLPAPTWYDFDMITTAVFGLLQIRE